MDDVTVLLSDIVTKISSSPRSDEEKAAIMAELSLGMRRLVWPILLSHIPEYQLREAVEQSHMTADDYLSLIKSSLSNPATPRELHDELMGALLEVRDVLSV